MKNFKLVSFVLPGTLAEESKQKEKDKKDFTFYSMMEIIPRKDLNHIEEENLKKFHHYFAL